MGSVKTLDHCIRMRAVEDAREKFREAALEFLGKKLSDSQVEFLKHLTVTVGGGTYQASHLMDCIEDSMLRTYGEVLGNNAIKAFMEKIERLSGEVEELKEYRQEVETYVQSSQLR